MRGRDVGGVRVKKSEFLAYILEDAFRDVQGITAKSMFGGYGLYKNGIVFGIIADDELYFKVDDKNRGTYEKKKSSPFTYETKKGKRVAMSYWRLPADILDERSQLGLWVEASVRASKRSSRKRKR